MGKILVMPDGNGLSCVSIWLEIAKALPEMGHTVIFASKDGYMKLPPQAGFQDMPVSTLLLSGSS